MSDITYFPTNSTKMWNKRMIETVQALPERFFNQTVKKKNKSSGKTETVEQKTKLAGRHITKLVTARYKLEKWQGRKNSVLVGSDGDDYEKGGIVKIKKEKKSME